MDSSSAKGSILIQKIKPKRKDGIDGYSHIGGIIEASGWLNMHPRPFCTLNNKNYFYT